MSGFLFARPKSETNAGEITAGDKLAQVVSVAGVGNIQLEMQTGRVGADPQSSAALATE